MLQTMMMAIACQSDAMNSLMAFLTTTGWSETRVTSIAERQLRHTRIDGLSDILAERQNVTTFAHRNGNADRRLTVHSEHRLRRIGQRAAHLGDIAQADQAPIRQKIDVKQIVFGLERAGHTDRQLLVTSLKRTRRNHGVLRLKRGNQGAPVDPEPCKLTVENST